MKLGLKPKEVATILIDCMARMLFITGVRKNKI